MKPSKSFIMHNYKINIDREPISSREIKSRRNFNAVKTGASKLNTPIHQSKWFWLNGILVLGVLGALMYWTTNTDEPIPEVSNLSINPPIEGLDIPFEEYNLQSEQSDTVVVKSGSSLVIPASSFVDKEGMPTAGEVKLQYREFHNADDIFLAGIPMKYDSAGVDYTLESAGMIEIKAYQNNKEVYLAPGKEIEVNLKSYKADLDYNLYSFNKDSANWIYEGKDSVTVIGPTQFNNEESLVSNKPETLLKEENILLALQKQTAGSVKKAPVLPQKLNGEKWNIKIDILESEFPELKSFNNVLWQLVGEEDIKSSDADEDWEDVNINRLYNNMHYQLVFSNAKRKVKYKVVPTYDEETYGKLKQDYDTKYALYQEELSKRKAQEKEQKRKIERLKKQLKEEQRIALEKANALNNNVYAIETNITRSFKVNGLGIWNCDRPIRFTNRQQYHLLLKDQDNKAVVVNTLFYIDTSINTVFRTFRARSVDNILFYPIQLNPQKSYVLLGVDSDNTLLVLSGNEFKEALSGQDKEVVVQLRKVDVKINSPKEFKRMYKKGFTNI